MIISTPDGRHRSRLTNAEKRQDVAARWNAMSDVEKTSVRHILGELDFLVNEGEHGFESLEEVLSYSQTYHSIADAHYVDRVITVDEFILDDHYLGHVGQHFYPQWRADMNELFAGRYTEAIITGSVGSGKCLDGDTEFYDPSKGCRLVLKDVCGDDDVKVSAYNKGRKLMVPRKARVKLSGEKYLGTLVLASGKKLRLSPDHPLLTPSGWEAVGGLGVGSLVATARSAPAPLSCYDVSDEEIEFVAFMLTEGSCSSGNWSFTNGSDACLRRFISAAGSLWFVQDRMSKSRRGVTVKENDAGKMTLYPLATKWLQHKYEMYGTSHSKRVPAEFFGLSDRQLGLFLNRVWACDGNINLNAAVTFEISLASEMFIRDIHQLLLRFGVHSRFKKRRVSYTYKGEKKWSWAWRLTVSGVENVGPMSEALGPILGKEKKWKAVREWVSANDGSINTNVDITPVDSAVSKRLQEDLGVSYREWNRNRIPVGQHMGHAKLAKIEEKYGLPKWCDWWAGVFWDRVVSFEVDDEMSPVYDVEVPGPKNFAPGGVIVHNTTFCDMSLGYMFYELCMLKDPQATFGLMPGSEIVLVCFNRDKKLARDVTFGGLKRKLEPSPFFQELGVKFGTSEMVYEKKNIRVIAISVRSADAMGRDVFGGIIDETDFFEGSVLRSGAGTGMPGEKPFAEALHESITRRMKSRFDRAGVLPGKLLLSSSARHKTSFTNKRIGIASNDPGVFCRDYAIYDVAPKERFSDRNFWVMVGNERIRHKILSKAEYKSISRRERERLIDQGCRFIRVPENFRKDFETNIEDSIRDIAGVVTVSLSPFIQLQDRIYEAVDPTLSHPLANETWATDEAPYIDWAKITAPIERRTGPGRKTMEIRPRRHPDAPRHVHIDLSLGAQDPAGICIAHMVDMVDVERRTEEGDPILDEAPIIEVDLLLRILPPANGEINFASVRGLVYDFMKHGYIFNFASADKFQSHDTIQQMESQGIDGEIVSVDKTLEPYTYLKTAIYEGRLSMYNYPIVLEELVHLQRDEARQKVDHPQGGSKDCLAGDTKISLLDGREVPISELVGQEVDVYSCTADGYVRPGRARNIHYVEDRPVVRVWLDNGESITCTEDHEIMMRDGSFRPAGELSDGDSLMPLYRRVSEGNSKTSLNGYEMVLENVTGKYIFTHQMVAEQVLGFLYQNRKRVREVIHHKDFNKRNNSSENLMPMEWAAHRDLHNREGETGFRKLWEDAAFRERAAKRSSDTGKRTGPVNITKYNKSPERIKKLRERGVLSLNGKITMEGLWSDPEYRRRHRERMTGASNPYARKDIDFGRVLEAAAVCRNQREMLGLLKCTQKVLVRILRENGLTYQDIKRKYGHCYREMNRRVRQQRAVANHRVVKVDRDVGVVPVYDMTVDGYHNFAVSSGVFVHNCADALAGVVFTLSTKISYRAPLMMGISEYEDSDSDSEWIRQTMTKSGKEAPQKVGDVPASGKPIVFTG